MVSKYNNNKPQSIPLHREEEPHNYHKTPARQTKQSTSSLFPIKMFAKLEWSALNKIQNAHKHGWHQYIKLFQMFLLFNPCNSGVQLYTTKQCRPDHTMQYAASDQGIYCFLTRILIQHIIKIKRLYLPPKHLGIDSPN